MLCSIHNIKILNLKLVNKSRIHNTFNKGIISNTFNVEKSIKKKYTIIYPRKNQTILEYVIYIIIIKIYVIFHMLIRENMLNRSDFGPLNL